MRSHGINVAFGQDCTMDPWYSLGGADMLDVAHMGLHVAQMTSREAMRFCFEAVTTNPATILQLDGYGLAVGNNADMVVLQAHDQIEAIRLRARRLFRIGRRDRFPQFAVSAKHTRSRELFPEGVGTLLSGNCPRDKADENACRRRRNPF
jgi:cytosine/adenosine deaminase-related metal-dependent hydrolase